MTTDHETWEELGRREAPSWYLHPLVAAQKRDVHLALIRRWSADIQPRRVLKTDLFEEAFGEDRLLPELSGAGGLLCGMDAAYSTVHAAARRHPELARGFVVMDARRCALAAASVDLVISTSTLDHFETRAEFLISIDGLALVLRPGGRLILTLDNPWNPLFHPLRWLTRRKGSPFPIGYSPSIKTLCRDLERAGFAVGERDWIIHNPRLLSTLLFVVIERLLGRRGDPLAQVLLWAFALLGRLPTRRFTACFQAVQATRLAGHQSPP